MSCVRGCEGSAIGCAELAIEGRTGWGIGYDASTCGWISMESYLLPFEGTRRAFRCGRVDASSE